MGIIGPQGPSGSIGVTGPTASVSPTSISPNGGQELAAGPGELGNTLVFTDGNVSQIIVTCAGAQTGDNVVGGGAELIPGNADVRGILESSFPNPAVANQWIITAEVTATGTTADSASSNVLEVIPYANCQPV